MQHLHRALEPILRRLSALLGRAVVSRVDDARRLQALQLSGLAGERLDGVESFQAYGLTSSPPIGSEALLACIGGQREHAIALGVAHRESRPRNLAAGEVTLYSQHGQSVKLKADGSIELVSESSIKLTVGGNSIELAGSGVTITSPTGTTTFQ